MIGRPVIKQLRRTLHVEAIGKKTLTLRGIAENPVTYRQLFLRDAAREEHSVDPGTTQKRFSTAHISEEGLIAKAEVKPGSVLGITWQDGKKSEYSLEFLQRYASQNSRLRYRRLDAKRWTAWPNGRIEPFKISFDAYMNDDKILFQALEALERDGLVLISGVPDRGSQDGSGPITVEDIALRVGYIKDTFYGRSWDVVSTPNAKNVAYTSVYLPLHMDLCYYESPPGIQLLHVIENSASGGESVFADSYAAALHILATDPQAYDALTKLPVTYHYVNDGHHYYFSRPTIVENPSGPIDLTTGRRPVSHLNYSPPFQGPLDAIATTDDDSGCGFSDATVAAFMRGLREFEKYIESQENQLTAKIPNGTCMLFQNRRILHGRREFTSDAGRRWLKGTYLDIDCFESKLRTLASSENL